MFCYSGFQEEESMTRYSLYNYYRRPKTRNEMRAYEPYVEDIDSSGNDVSFRIHIRGRRSPEMLPDSYDDILRSRYRDRSWKNCWKSR